MYLVLKHVDGRDCGIDSDGTVQRDIQQAELYATEAEAVEVAKRFGGIVETDERVLGEDW